MVSHKCTTEALLTANLNDPLAAGYVPFWHLSKPLTRYHFSAVKPRAPGNLTIHPTSQTWVLTWSNPYPDENYLHRELTYLVNVSNEHDPADVSGHCGVSPPPPGTWAGGDSGSGAGQQTQGPRLVLRPDPPCLQASIPRGREGKLFLGTALMCKGKLWGPVYILGDGTLEILGGSLAAP